MAPVEGEIRRDAPHALGRKRDCQTQAAVPAEGGTDQAVVLGVAVDGRRLQRPPRVVTHIVVRAAAMRVRACLGQLAWSANSGHRATAALTASRMATASVDFTPA